MAVLLATVAAAVLCVAPAAAAPLPVHLGQAASSFNIEGATNAGGCQCTVAQFHDVGPTSASYTIPFNGVIVASGFYIGNSVDPVDSPTAQVQTVHVTGASTGSVVSEGETHSLLGLPKNTVDSFYERLPAHAGDVLAARFHNSGFIQATPFFFKSAATGDSTEGFAPTAAGGSLSSGTATAERRLNLETILEPDEDGDGYGDVSQDLCPASPIAVSACSGTLFGSDLQGPRSTSLPNCGSGGCMRIQTSVGGVSTAAPVNGVVVRWRVLNGDAGPFRVRVVTFNAGSSGGMFRSYNVIRSSAVENVAARTGLFSAISSFPTRLPIPAGGYVALAGATRTEAFQQSSGAATYSSVDEVGDGLGASGETHNGTVLYDADIEPDVDGDGYGDVSQDSCPTDATVHEGPCPSTGGGTGSGGGGASGSSTLTGGRGSGAAAAPKIKSLAVKPRSFRAKPVDGAVARGAMGTKFKLDISAQVKSKVTLTIVKNGKRLWTLAKQLGPGPASVSYNGRYRKHGKVAALAPGSYVLMARVAGSGVTKQTTFTVLPPS
jgi:hypothetical protein